MKNYPLFWIYHLCIIGCGFAIRVYLSVASLLLLSYGELSIPIKAKS
jgi:hypothetical protein